MHATALRFREDIFMTGRRTDRGFVLRDEEGGEVHFQQSDFFHCYCRGCDAFVLRTSKPSDKPPCEICGKPTKVSRVDFTALLAPK